MTATWNEIFFASEVDFDHPSLEEREATGLRESQSSGRIASFVGSVSATVVGTFAAVALTVGSPDMTHARIVQSALDDEVAVVEKDRAAVGVPDDVLAPGPQNLAGLARILRLGRPAEGLDHLL